MGRMAMMIAEIFVLLNVTCLVCFQPVEGYTLKSGRIEEKVWFLRELW